MAEQVMSVRQHHVLFGGIVVNHFHFMCEETPTNLRMGVPAPITNFASLSVTLTETQREAAINSTYQTCQNARELEDRLEMQSQLFVMLGINAESYNDVVWIASKFFGALNNWWLNRKHKAAIIDSFDSLVVEIHKTSMFPNIRNDAINAMLGLTQGSLSYAKYTHLFDDFLQRSRQPLRDDLQCARLINGLANFQL
jgi:hypothetical protein